MPSMCAMETYLNVFRNEDQFVLLRRPANYRCLDEHKKWCSVYRVALYDAFKVSRNSVEPEGSIGVDGEVFPSDNEFLIPPKSTTEFMKRLQRFDFRYPENTTTLFFATGCNRDSIRYNHNGLVILPNYNFISEFSSKIGTSVKVYNSTGTPLIYETSYGIKSVSPVGVLFEHLPFGKAFEVVTAQSFPT